MSEGPRAWGAGLCSRRLAQSSTACAAPQLRGQGRPEGEEQGRGVWGVSCW